MDITAYRRILKTEYGRDSAGREYKRKVDPANSAWKPVENTEPDSQREVDGLVNVYAVYENQAPGEPRHWYILIAKDESTPGYKYQVTGDNTFMRFETTFPVPWSILTDDYAGHDLIATVSLPLAAVVADICRLVPPPWAATRASVQANCQTWVIQVVDEMSRMGLCSRGWVVRLNFKRDPIK